jgi:non-homologous end joining protein Ku
MLLRDDLVESDKIAMVVIRTRQHFAAVKPQKKGLMLELMHISTEENSPNMPEYRGLFDEAISQRDR